VDSPLQRSLTCSLRVLAWLLSASLLTGCASIYGFAGILASNIKFPITWEGHEKRPQNRPLEVEVHEALVRYTREFAAGLDSRAPGSILGCDAPPRTAGECLDPALGRGTAVGHTAVIIAISGGGARASVFAGYALALLERSYNRLLARFRPDSPPMIELVDAFSTVSGGSLYAFHLARRIATPRSGLPPEVTPLVPLIFREPLAPCALPGEFERHGAERAEWYVKLCRTVEDRRRMRTLGSAAARSAFGAFGLGIPAALFTDRGYVDHIARGLEFHYGTFSLANPFLIAGNFLQLGDLPTRPRFFFNATALETGAPFVITQNVMNLTAGSLPGRSVRLDVQGGDEPRDGFRSLRQSLTLEEIGSSPRLFPLAYAAAASAAFPAGVQPLPLRRYDYRPGLRRFEPVEARLSLADGGIFDNSGMMTAADFFEHLAERRGVRRMVLIAINADASEYDLAFKEHAFPPKSGVPMRARWPISFSSITDSMDLIHFINKRRGEEMAWRQMDGSDKQVEAAVQYFPLGLAQLSEDDLHSIPGGDSLFRLVRQIGTSYWLSRSDEVLLERAASVIANAEQVDGWRVGPDCPGAAGPAEVSRLGDALAFALLRAGGESWSEPIVAEPGSEWCPRAAPGP
jgi:hypothetical protein